MVICCVPRCGTGSWSCDPTITFHDFPSSPDIAAKWIKQINYAIKSTPMWIPRGRSVICSKHFLQTDFKDNTDALKPRCVPTIFGHKFIGENAESKEPVKVKEITKSPLIVKVINPQVETVLENNSNIEISAVHSQVDINKNDKSGDPFKVQTIFHRSLLPQNNISVKKPVNSAVSIVPSKNILNPSKQLKIIDGNVSPQNNGFKRNIDDPSKIYPRKKEKTNNDLIEIGPNTFLKINPDIIKVNKKLTPSGNTVLQFLMDQKLANSKSSKLFPTIVHGPLTKPDKINTNLTTSSDVQSTSNNEADDSNHVSASNNQSNGIVQHVLGHLVDTHVCEDSCADLRFPNESVSMNDENVDDPLIVYETSQSQNKYGNSSNIFEKTNGSNTVSSFLEKAPVLLTTKMPISHCFNDKPRYLMQLKQKNRQVASLKFKISNMTKKVEELEDRCIVQERQLSYSFIKRLKTIRKNSAKGDPTATYILEQIRSYTNNSKMRWSDSTLAQCAIWCRKAPYAYEYFKKADFFKLPCLGTVKRFMKKHPEVKSLKKNMSNPEDDESSSDFDFDESDDQNNDKGLSDNENNEPTGCETIMSVDSETSNPKTAQETVNQTHVNGDEKSKNRTDAENTISQTLECNSQLNAEITSESVKSAESTSIPLTLDSSNMELQEIMLPSGEIVQCYSSSISNSGDGQYFIIPNVGDQNGAGDHEYSVVQADSLPALLQNLEHSQHLHQEQQLIFITNSTDQVECSEMEVTTA